MFRTQPLRWHVVAGVSLGFTGVAVLLLGNGGQHLALIPYLVILAAGVAWSSGSVLSSRLQLPASRPLTAGAEMVLSTGYHATHDAIPPRPEGRCFPR